MLTPDEIRAFVLEHKVQFRPKSESRWMRMIGWFLAVLHINANFMTSYVTTLGRSVYYPDRWRPFSIELDSALMQHASTLEHEFVHVRQWERWNVLYAFAYIFLPIPLGLAWFRWKFEREAYIVNIRNGRSIEACVNALWKYGWPWPKSWMRKWFQEQTKE